MKLLTIILCLSLSACATGKNYLDVRREALLKCMTDLKASDTTTMDAFEVCRQLYGLRKVKD